MFLLTNFLLYINLTQQVMILFFELNLCQLKSSTLVGWSFKNLFQETAKCGPKTPKKQQIRSIQCFNIFLPQPLVSNSISSWHKITISFFDSFNTILCQKLLLNWIVTSYQTFFLLSVIRTGAFIINTLQLDHYGKEKNYWSSQAFFWRNQKYFKCKFLTLF